MYEFLRGSIVPLGPCAVAASPDTMVVVAAQGVGNQGGVVGIRAGLLSWRWDGVLWSEAIPLPVSPGLASQRACILSTDAMHLHAFAIAPDEWSAGPCLLRWRSLDGGHTWIAPESLGGNLPSGENGINGVAACTSSPTLYHIICVASGNVVGGGAIQHWASDGVTVGGPWSIPQSSLHTQVPAITSRAGRIDVFAIDGSTGGLMHWWATDSSDLTNDLVWSGPTLMPGTGSTNIDVGANGVEALVSPANDRIDVFVIDRDGTLWNWFGDGDDANWVGPYGLPGTGGSQSALPQGVPGAAWTSGNRLQVYAVGQDNSLQQWEWDGQVWSLYPKRVIPGPYLAPSNSVAVVARGSRVDAFAIGNDNQLVHWPAPVGVTHQHWENWAKTQSADPLLTFSPTSLGEVVAIVQSAEANHLRVRASGSHWSFTDVAVCRDYVVETDGLSSLINGVVTERSAPILDVLSASARAHYAANPKRHLVHVEAGIKLRALCEVLDSEFGWALPTMGGSAGQSLAGAVSNGVHGGDYDRPPVPDLVRAIHLVGPGGVQYWIERADPLTNPSQLAARLAQFGVDPAHIQQNDDWFYSVLVSMGCLGIVYSYVVEVVDQYWLAQSRLQLSWENPTTLSDGIERPPVRDMLGNRSSELFGVPGGPRAANHYVEVLINPNREPNGSHTCYLTMRQDVPEPDEPSPPSFCSALAMFGSEVGNAFVSALETAITALGAQFTPDPQDATVGDVVAAALNVALNNGHAGAFAAIEDLMLGSFGSATQPGQPNIDKSWLVMAGPAESNTFKSLTVEVAFDDTDLAHLRFVERAFAVIDEMMAVGQQPVGGLFSLRYTGRSGAFLAMSRFARNCHIEIDMLRGLQGSAEFLQRMERLALELGGIQHWGMFQVLNDADGAVTRAYSARPHGGATPIARWRAVRDALTNGGQLVTFANAFSWRCGLTHQ